MAAAQYVLKPSPPQPWSFGRQHSWNWTIDRSLNPTNIDSPTVGMHVYQPADKQSLQAPDIDQFPSAGSHTNGRRRTSILSFLSHIPKPSLPWSQKSRDGEEEDDEVSSPVLTPDTFSSRRASVWSRTSRRSSAFFHRRPSEDLFDALGDMGPISPMTVPEPDYYFASIKDYIGPEMTASHEISFLDSVIPEEGLVEDEEYDDDDDDDDAPYTNVPVFTFASAGTLETSNTEWGPNEADAERPASQVIAPKDEEDEPRPRTAASPSSDGIGLERVNEDDDDDESEQPVVKPTRHQRKSTGTNRILEKLGIMAGLNPTHHNGRKTRGTRSKSVPSQRKYTMSMTKEKQTSKEREMSEEDMNISTVPMTRVRSKSVAFAEGRPDEEYSETCTGHAKTNSSMWDSLKLQRRKAKRSSIFGIGRLDRSTITVN